MNLHALIHRTLQQQTNEGGAGGGGAGGEGGAGGAGGAGAGGAGGQGGGAPWFPEAHKSVVETKGFKSIEDVFQWGINAEKLIGADRAGRTIVLPKDDKDAEGIKAFRAKLGVPDSADKYELPVPQGDDGKFAKQVSSWFFDAGVPKAAAQKLGELWNNHLAETVKAIRTEEETRSSQALAGLKTEWGNDFQKNEELARRGLKAYGEKAGLDTTDLERLETAIGTAKMLKMFQTLGVATGESGFAGGGGNNNFGVTKQQAQAKVDEMRLKRANGEITDAQWRGGMQAEFEKYAEIAGGT